MINQIQHQTNIHNMENQRENIEREPFRPIKNFKVIDIQSMINSKVDQFKNDYPLNDLTRKVTITASSEDDILTDTQRGDRAKDFLITMVLWLVAYQFLLGLFIEYQPIFKNKEFLDVLNPTMMVLLGVSSIYKIYSCVYPPSSYGLNLNNWKNNLIESLLWTMYFIAGLIFFKFCLVQFVPYYHGKPIFDFNDLNRFSTGNVILVYIAYILLVPIQEFVARGVIQGSLELFLTGKNKVVSSIFLSNLLFGAFHIHYDLKFAVLTVLAGIFWGVMYARQQSLLGVSVSHIIIGTFTLLCMGLL